MIQVRSQYGNIYVKIVSFGKSFDIFLDRVLTIPGRVYKADTNEWMFGKEVLHELLSKFSNQIIWAQPLEEIVGDDPIDSELVRKHIEWSKDDAFASFKMKPYPYQAAGAHFLAERGQAATFDGVGLGKTIQLIGAFHLLKQEGKVSKALIVTLSSIKGQWAREVQKFTNYQSIAALGTKTRRMKTLKEFQSNPDIQFLVINYEMLRDNEFMEVILNSGIGFVGLDEAQMIKSGIDDFRVKLKPSQTALGAHRLKVIPYRFIATATPVQNKAEEIFSLFYFLNDSVLGDWETYKNQYCEIHDRFGITGSKNLEYLYMKIAPYFIRRTKEMPEIQQQLPKTTHSKVFLPMTKTQITLENAIKEKLEEYKELKKSIQGDTVINGNLMSPKEQEEYYDGLSQGLYNFLISNLDLPLTLNLPESSNISKGMIEELNLTDKELSKSPKLDYLKDYVKQVIHDEPSSKIVIFTEFARMANILYQELSDIAVLYTGQVSEQAKEDAVVRLQNDPSIRVFIGTSAADTGLNLNFCNYMIHYDLPFNPTDIEQRNGRIDRTGNPFENLTFLYLLMEDSYEEELLVSLSKKKETAKAILYGGD